MNKQKGFFRLTLVLSILIGIATPFCHKWIFDKSEVEVDFPADWGKRSLQEKLNSIDELLSGSLRFFLLSKIEQLNIRRQLKGTIISDAKYPIEPRKKTDLDLSFLPDQPNRYPLIGYIFSFEAGWRELSLLAFIGFASPWLIYLFIRWIVIYFIVRGFRSKTTQ